MTSTGIARTLRLAFDLLSAEGPRGLLERLAERGAELCERFGERRVGLDRAALGDLHAPVLDVLATPLVARGGGVPLQYRARRAEEARMRTVALLAQATERGVALRHAQRDAMFCAVLRLRHPELVEGRRLWR